MFEDIITDDVKAATGVFERAGLPVTDECLADLDAYMAGAPARQGRPGRLRPRG